VGLSDTFLQKNMGRSFADILQDLASWKELFAKNGKTLESVIVSNSFGCFYEGRIPSAKLVERIEQFQDRWGAELPEVILADTVGMGLPDQVQEFVELIQAKFASTKVALHLHDTNGMAIANAYVGLQSGVRIFEGSVAGVGGCPFTAGASGNVATEKLIYLFHGLGFETGCDFARYTQVAKIAREIFSL